jgi:tape measure domain-containing protein
VSVVANVAINVDSRNAVSKLRQVQTQATATQRAFGALQSAIAGIGVASIAAQTLKAAASFNDLQTRLKLLTSEYGEYTQAQQFAAKAAKQFGLSNREAATGVADIYARLRPLGVSLKDIQSTFNGFNTIARLSGVSAAGASSAFLQLGQALGSGRLQGDEFRSIAEQIPGLLVAVSKETGIAAKDLKKFASDGKLSADIVINALKRIESEGAGKIAALVRNSDTQKFKDLQNAVDDLSVAVGNELLPVVTPLIKDLTSLVGTIAALPDPVKNATGEIVKLIIQLVLVEKAIKAIIGLNAAFVAAQVAMAGATASTGVAATTSAGAFALYTNNARTLQAASVAATASVSGLAGALLGLAGIGIITVGINYVITQTGAIIGSSTAAGKSEAAGTAGGLAAQLKGKSAAERKQMLAAAQKNLANDKKLASALALQIQMQDNAALSSSERALPSDRSKLTELQARINTNQGRIKAIQTTPIERATPKPKPTLTPTPTTATGTGAGKGAGAKKGNDDAKRAAEQIQQQLKAADDINFALKNRLAITQETEAVAKRMIEFDVRQNEIAREYDELKKAAKGADELALINANLVIEQRIAQIEAERDINELLIQRAALMADTVRQAGMPTVYNELEEQDAALQAVLDKYPAIGAAADAAATLATSGISEMIAGTKSAEQVFVEFLSSIADALINTAKQMIAQYIALGIARMFAMGSSPGGFAPSGPLAAVGNINPMPTSFTPIGNINPIPTSFTPFAQGGFVTGPTNAIIGEGGESEYVIPSSKMNAAMSRYSRGARGEGVIAGSGGGTEGESGAAAAGPMAIDVRYSVERINDVEYVTASQFQAGMRQAAQQGAAQGEQRTLRRLQQSPSTRKRVGV